MNIYICDDIPEEGELIHKKVKKFALFSETEVLIHDVFIQPEALLAQFEMDSTGVNVFILDIDFHNSKMNGLVLGKKIKEIDPQSYIIFVTSHAEMSFLTFEYHIGAIDYIVKGTHSNWDRKIIDSLQTIEHRLRLVNERMQENLVLETANDLIRVPFSDILFFESSTSNKLSCTTLNGQYMINKKTLKSLEEELASDFWRCHRSFLINKNHIISYKKDYHSVTLEQDFVIPVASRKRGELKKILPAI